MTEPGLEGRGDRGEDGKSSTSQGHVTGILHTPIHFISYRIFLLDRRGG